MLVPAGVLVMTRVLVVTSGDWSSPCCPSSVGKNRQISVNHELKRQLLVFFTPNNVLLGAGRYTGYRTRPILCMHFAGESK